MPNRLPVILVITILNTFLFRFIEKEYRNQSQLEAKPKVNQESIPVQLKGEDDEFAEACCGGLTEQDWQAFKHRLESAWASGSDSDPEISQILPAHFSLDQAETVFKRTPDPFMSDGESEIDWDETRLQMLLGAEASGGEVSKAMVAEMMLEADSFMKTMTEADAEAIAQRAQEIWERMSLKLPEQMLEGTNAVIWRKTFELQAVVERSMMVFEDTDDLNEMETELHEHLKLSPSD